MRSTVSQQRAIQILRDGAAEVLGRPLSETEEGSFVNYLNLLRNWSASQRLVGSTDPEWIVSHLFLDSLLFLRVLPAKVRSMVDVGSGAGFPGIPLRIVKADIGLTLVESRRRRASFLAAVVRGLRLEDVRVVNARLEEVAEALAGRFDAVVMRCAGPHDELFPVASKLLVKGGVVVASGAPQRDTGAELVSVPGLEAGGSRHFVLQRRE